MFVYTTLISYHHGGGVPLGGWGSRRGGWRYDMPDRYVIKSFARNPNGKRLWQYGVDVIVNGVLTNIYTLTMDNSNHDMKTKDRDHDVGAFCYLLLALFPDAHVETHYLNS